MVKRPDNGFTLIELMTTLSVLAILVAIAAPSFTGMIERRKLSGAADKLYADMMFAKTEAIKRNRPVVVSFSSYADDGATWCYGISLDTACDCNAVNCTIDGVTKVTNQDEFTNVSVEENSTFDGSSTTFSPVRGTAGSGHLRFSIGSGANLGVVVNNIGRVRMCTNGNSFNVDACP